MKRNNEAENKKVLDRRNGEIWCAKSVWFLAVNVSAYTHKVRFKLDPEINAIFNIFSFHCIHEKTGK